MHLNFGRFLALSLFLTALAQTSFAQLPSLAPADYDLENARSEYQSAMRDFEQRDDEINSLRAKLASIHKEIAKLQAQNKRLKTINPDHPQLPRNAKRITKLQSEIPLLQRRLPHLEKGLVPFKDTRDRARQRLERIEQNVEQAEQHLHQRTEDLATIAQDFAHDQGRLEGDRDGYRLGFEAGRALGEQLGIHNARTNAIETGRQSGNQEGMSAGASEAVRFAYQTGEADAWEERGYADGYSDSHNAPNRTDRTYSLAYDIGLKRAQNEAYSSYLPGVEKADAQYRSLPLSSETHPNLKYNINARPWVSLANQPSFIESLPERAIPLKNRKRPNLTYLPLPDSLHLAPVDNTLSPPNIAIDFQPRRFKPRSVPFISIPTARLQRFFEKEYRHHYLQISRIAYENAYVRHFERSFHRTAEEQISIHSNPNLYGRIAEEAEAEAFSYFFEEARSEIFNRDYPRLYQQVREKAYRSPDRNSTEYQSAYQDGTYNALVKVGYENGYQENIQLFRETEKERGYADREQYYKTNAVLTDIRFHLEDDNRDGVFAINEPFHLSIDLKNLGLTPQGPQQAKIRLHVVDGPATTTKNVFTLPPLSSQSAQAFQNCLSGIVQPYANAKQIITLRAEFVDFGQVSYTQTFRIKIDYPFELSHANHPRRLFSNQVNNTFATIKNTTSKASPSSIQLRLTNANGQPIFERQLQGLDAGQSNDLVFNYLISQRNEFTSQELTLEATCQGVVQLRHTFPRVFVSKRFASDSELLLILNDLTRLDLLPLKRALEAQGRGFDLYALDQEPGPPSQSLVSNYRDGYVIANLGRNPDSDTASLLQSLFKEGGSLLVASPNFSRNEAWVDFLTQLGLKITDKTSTQNLKGQSVLAGSHFRKQFTTNTRLTLRSPQKNVISYPLIRSDKRRGFGMASFHASRSLHPINLNTFSLATFDLEELDPEELADLVGKLSTVDLEFSQTLEQLPTANAPEQVEFLAKLIETRLIESHVLAERLKDKGHKAAALLNYQERFESFIDFAYRNRNHAVIKPKLREIATELSRKRHSKANRSELKTLLRTLKS